MEETFRPIKNAVIKAALGINNGEIPIEESLGKKKSPKKEECRKRIARSYAVSLLHSISGIFETACNKESEKLSDGIDRRLQREIEAKKMGETMNY